MRWSGEDAVSPSKNEVDFTRRPGKTEARRIIIEVGIVQASGNPGSSGKRDGSTRRDGILERLSSRFSCDDDLLTCRIEHGIIVTRVHRRRLQLVSDPEV